MRVDEVLETCLYAEDLAAAETFYAEVLGLDLFVKEENRHVFFRCGRTMLLVFNPQVTSKPVKGFEVPRHGAVGPVHVCFTFEESEIEAWKDRLADHGVEIEQEMEWPTGGYSIYFRDPAGNSLELATRRTWNPSE